MDLAREDARRGDGEPPAAGGVASTQRPPAVAGRLLTTAAAAVVVLVAAVLRFWGAFDLNVRIGDEPFHVPSAINMSRYGVPLAMNWTHPPGGALILQGTIGLFGDDPVGWRIGGVLLGTFTVALLYAGARRLTRSHTVSLLAAALLALDPFHVYFSRSTFMEVPVLCFFLLFLWSLQVYEEEEKGWALVLAGVALGLTAATKSYFAVSAALAIAWVVRATWVRTEARAELILRLVCYLGLLPAAVYLGSFLQYFGDGHSLAEFVRMRADAFRTLRAVAPDAVDPWWLREGGGPWEWFVRPISLGYRIDEPLRAPRYLLELNNFPIRPIALVALTYLAVRGVRERRARLLVPALLFASVYLLFLALSRPMLSYSALVVLPFAYVALAWSVRLLERRHARLRGLSLAVLALTVLWGGYQYPLATAKEVPGWLYGPILSGAALTGLPR